MGVDYDVPFVSNTPDDLHCLQAAYMMIVKFFMPGFSTSQRKWDKLTGFEQGKGTWASAGLLWFREHGFEVEHWSLFDYPAFVRDAPNYLLKMAGPEVGQWQIEHSNLPTEQKLAEQLLQSVSVHQQEPTTQLIKDFLDQGYLIRCLVNSRKLNGQKGYFGHAVVIKGYSDKEFILHDPGLPVLENRHVLFHDFESAWAYPNKESKELDAIRKTELAD